MKADSARSGEGKPQGPSSGSTFDQLLRAISDGIVATDAAGAIVFANPAAAIACGVAVPADLVGRSLAEIAARFEISDEDDRPLSFADLPGAHAIAGRASERLVRYRQAGSSDDVRWALVKATPALGAGGEVLYAVQVIRDVTDRERERQRQQAENARLVADAKELARSRDDLLAIVSHDLRNPLGVVLTSSALLLRGPLPTDKGDRARRQIEAIQRAGNRMNRLIRDLLDLASIQAGELALTRRACDVGTLIQDVVDVLLPSAAPKGQELRGEPLAEPLTIDCDHERMVQVLSNVVGNSCKFGQEGCHVSVRAAADGTAIRFTVADDGPGMAPEELDNLFNRAWQAGRKSRDGIGLGLTIVKGIVEAHGGRVWAESAPGQGTRVSFTIPAAASASQ